MKKWKFKFFKWILKPFLKQKNAHLLILKNRQATIYIPGVGITKVIVPWREYLI